MRRVPPSSDRRLLRIARYLAETDARPAISMASRLPGRCSAATSTACRERPNPSLREPPALEAYSLLRAQLVDFFTAAGAFPEPERTAIGIAQPYERLLDSLGVPPGAAKARIADLVNGVTELLDSTPHLCWAKASGGEILHLQVTYTTRDPRHAPTYSGLTQAANTNHEPGSARANLYRDFGLAPIKHELDIPSEPGQVPPRLF